MAKTKGKKSAAKKGGKAGSKAQKEKKKTAAAKARAVAAGRKKDAQAKKALAKAKVKKDKEKKHKELNAKRKTDAKRAKDEDKALKEALKLSKMEAQAKRKAQEKEDRKKEKELEADVEKERIAFWKKQGANEVLAKKNSKSETEVVVEDMDPAFETYLSTVPNIEDVRNVVRELMTEYDVSDMDGLVQLGEIHGNGRNDWKAVRSLLPMDLAKERVKTIYKVWSHCKSVEDEREGTKESGDGPKEGGSKVSKTLLPASQYMKLVGGFEGTHGKLDDRKTPSHKMLSTLYNHRMKGQFPLMKLVDICTEDMCAEEYVRETHKGTKKSLVVDGEEGAITYDKVDEKLDPAYMSFYRVEEKMELLQTACVMAGYTQERFWLKIHIEKVVEYGASFGRNRPAQYAKAEALIRAKMSAEFVRKGGRLNEAIAMLYGGWDAPAMRVWKKELVEIAPEKLVTGGKDAKDAASNHKRLMALEQAVKKRRIYGDFNVGAPSSTGGASATTGHDDFWSKCLECGVVWETGKGDRICFDQNYHGTCPFGDNCKYAHDCALKECHEPNCTGLTQHKEVLNVIKKAGGRKGGKGKGKGKGKGGGKGGKSF